MQQQQQRVIAMAAAGSSGDAAFAAAVAAAKQPAVPITVAQAIYVTRLRHICDMTHTYT